MKSFTRNFPKIFALLACAAFAGGIFLLASPAMAKNPYLQPDRTWITLSGTVESVTADSFILDYGEGAIIVEMDDGDRDADGYKLIAGDEVTVNGMIDDDFYQTTTIEASSVYEEKLGTTFFASALDEEDVFATVVTPIVASTTIVQGVVTETGSDEFPIDTDLKSLTVDTKNQLYNPLDEVGYQGIEKGDRVRVAGTIDRNLFAGRELIAETVTELVN